MRGLDSESPWLLVFVEAVENWDGEMISWSMPEGSWELEFFEVHAISKDCVFGRDDRSAGRDRGWGSGSFSSSGCHLALPGMSGWVGRGWRESRLLTLRWERAGRLDGHGGRIG